MEINDLFYTSTAQESCEDWFREIKDELEQHTKLLSERYSFDFETGLPIEHPSQTFIWEVQARSGSDQDSKKKDCNKQ